MYSSVAEHLSPLLLVLGAVTVLQPVAAQNTGRQIEEADIAVDPVPTAELGPGLRDPVPATRIALWGVTISGRSFQDLANDEASVLVGTCLYEAARGIAMLEVMDRSTLEAELGLEAGLEPTEEQLLRAARALRAELVLVGQITNQGTETTMELQWLDASTGACRGAAWREMPFVPVLTGLRAEADELVAALAAELPLTAELVEVLDRTHVTISLGAVDGLVPGLSVSIRQRNTGQVIARGYILESGPWTAFVELVEPTVGVSLIEDEAQVRYLSPLRSVRQRGMLYLAQGRAREAASLYADAARRHPQRAEILVGLARSLRLLGQIEGAAERFLGALRAGADEPGLLQESVECLVAAARYRAVVDLLALRTALSPRLLLLRGIALDGLGSGELAERAYRQAIASGRAPFEVSLRLALAATRRGDATGTTEALGAAAAAPDARPWERTLVEDLLGGRPPSEAALLEGAAIGAGDTALITFGELLMALRAEWNTGAQSVASARLDRAPEDVRASLLFARAEASRGLVAESLTSLEALADRLAEPYAARIAAGEILVAAGRPDEAVTFFEQASALGVDHGAAEHRLGDLAAARDDQGAAASHYQAALARLEGEGALDLAPLLGLLGRSLVLSGDPTAARAPLERCTLERPGDESCRFYLGQALFADESGSSDELALAAFDAAPSFPDRFSFLGRLHDRRHEVGEAAEAYQACLDAGCSQADETRRRLDEIESMTALVSGLRVGGRDEGLILSIGSVHGVTVDARAVVVGRPDAIVRVEEVERLSSVAEAKKGTIRVGDSVRFRPTRPRDVTVTPSGDDLVVRWRPNPEPEVERYLVYRVEGTSGSGLGERIKRVKADEHEILDKSVKSGRTYVYRIVAENDFDALSLPSHPVGVAVP